MLLQLAIREAPGKKTCFYLRIAQIGFTPPLAAFSPKVSGHFVYFFFVKISIIKPPELQNGTLLDIMWRQDRNQTLDKKNS